MSTTSTITIKNLVDIAAASGGLTKTAAEKLLSDVFSSIGGSLAQGDEVVIKDLGRLYTKTRPARLGRNPKTGQAVQVGERTVVKFSPRGEFKSTL